MQVSSLLCCTLLAISFPVVALGDAQVAGRMSYETSQPPVSQTAAIVEQAEGNTALVRIDRFHVVGNTLLDAGLIEQKLNPFKGPGRSYTDIQRALEELEGAYRNAGYSAVHVFTPEQEVTEGTITFEVIESRIGKIVISGNEYYDRDNIRNALPALIEGTIPSARKLSENLRLANESATRQLDVVLAVGEMENTVDARINVQDSSPHKLFAIVDNTGNHSTGMYRAGIGYQNNNLFNRDHAATFSYTTSPDHINDVTQLSASYRLPLYSLGDSIDLIAAYSDTNAGTTGTVAGPLTFSGKGHVLNARYNHYLPRHGDYTSKIIGGIDYRAYLNSCTLNGGSCAGVADVAVHPLSLAYNGTWAKPTHTFDYTATLLHNLPGGSHGRDADFSAARPNAAGGEGAKAGYTILRMNGSLTGALPQNWQYRLAGNLQHTSDALVSGETLGLVGSNAVRGFIERELSSDKGYVINTELYTPEMASLLGLQNGSLRLLGFVDHANGKTVPLAGETGNSVSAGSAGIGARFNYGRNLMARFDLARVTEGGGKSDPGDVRGHVSVVVNW